MRFDHLITHFNLEVDQAIAGIIGNLNWFNRTN